MAPFFCRGAVAVFTFHIFQDTFRAFLTAVHPRIPNIRFKTKTADKRIYVLGPWHFEIVAWCQNRYSKWQPIQIQAVQNCSRNWASFRAQHEGLFSSFYLNSLEYYVCSKLIVIHSRRKKDRNVLELFSLSVLAKRHMNSSLTIFAHVHRESFSYGQLFSACTGLIIQNSPFGICTFVINQRL